MPNLLLLGCGGVGSAMLELLPHLSFSFSRITILDPRDLSEEPMFRNLRDYPLYRNGTTKIVYIRTEVTPENLVYLLDTYGKDKDLVLDLSFNIAFQPLVQWCLDHSVSYLNTSMERWPMANEEDLDLRPEALKARSLLSLHQQARELHPEKGETKSTIVFEHGMNPGLLSHLVKHGLAQISREILTQKEIPELASAYSSSDFARMAYYLGLEVVHCSEKDTQIPLIPRKPGEFLNTWGAYSLYGEGVDPVQIGLGTHEPLFTEEGTLFENQLILPSRGAFTYGHSYVPLVGKINGMIIPHGENDSVNRTLTLRNEKMLVYRPSNYYVYSPAKMAWDSLEEVRQNNYKFLPSPQSLRGYQLLDGMDAVGALLIFRSDPRQKLLHDRETEPASYWVGSILSLAQTRAMGFRYAGPTTLQVAISVVTAVRWILENPGRGICFPEDLPYAEILDACIPYLGTFWSDWVDYRPESTEWRYFLGRDRLQKAVRL